MGQDYIMICKIRQLQCRQLVNTVWTQLVHLLMARVLWTGGVI